MRTLSEGGTAERENLPCEAVAFSIRPIRGFVRRFATGVITTATTTAVVVGVSTKFLSQSMTSSTNFYRARDMTYIGTITNIASDTSITFVANSAVPMDNEPYVAFTTSDASSVQVNNASGLFTTTTELAVTVNARTVLATPGYLTAAHAYRQWYANLGVAAQPTGEFTSRVWFSELKMGEA